MTRFGPALVLLLAACGPEAPSAAPPAPEPAPPPAPAAIPLSAPTGAAVRLPDWTEFRTARGARGLLVEDHEVPLVSFEVRLAGGALADRPGREGTAAILAELLRKGAGARDARQFQADVDFVGGTFTTSAHGRWIEIGAEFLSEDRDLALGLLDDVLTRPRLDAAEFEKVRALAIDRIRAARQEPGAVIGTYWNQWLLRARGVTTGGDERSLAAVRLEDVQAAWKACSDPASAWIAVAGDVDRAWLADRLGPLGDVGPTPPEAPRYDLPGGVAPRRVLLVDKPDAIQTYFRFGGRGFDWSDPDYPARYVANTILGGRFTSRLNTALRVESGLSYGARSWFDDDLDGAFSVYSYTATETSREALELGMATYRGFVAGGLTQEELDSARAYIKGQYAPGRLETGAQAAAMILALTFDGLSRDLVDGFFARLDALTLDVVNRVVSERFPRPEDATWVVIGRAEILRDVVRNLGTVTETSLAGPGFAPD